MGACLNMSCAKEEMVSPQPTTAQQVEQKTEVKQKKVISAEEHFGQIHNQLMDSIAFDSNFPFTSNIDLFTTKQNDYNFITNSNLDFNYSDFSQHFGLNTSSSSILSLASAMKIEGSISSLEEDYIKDLDALMKASDISSISSEVDDFIDDVNAEEELSLDQKSFLKGAAYVGLYSYTYWWTVFQNPTHPWTVQFGADPNNPGPVFAPRWWADVRGWLSGFRQGWSTDENPFFVAKVVSGIMSGDHGS